MVAVDVEVVEETGSLYGNSSIQETKKLVGVVAMVAEPRDSRSYNFALKVERGSIENKMKGIVYSCSAYYSNYSCYSNYSWSHTLVSRLPGLLLCNEVGWFHLSG